MKSVSIWIKDGELSVVNKAAGFVLVISVPVPHKVVLTDLGLFRRRATRVSSLLLISDSFFHPETGYVTPPTKLRELAAQAMSAGSDHLGRYRAVSCKGEGYESYQFESKQTVMEGIEIPHTCMWSQP